MRFKHSKMNLFSAGNHLRKISREAGAEARARELQVSMVEEGDTTA